jgi:hypothetical protein
LSSTAQRFDVQFLAATVDKERATPKSFDSETKNEHFESKNSESDSKNSNTGLKTNIFSSKNSDSEFKNVNWESKNEKSESKNPDSESKNEHVEYPELKTKNFGLKNEIFSWKNSDTEFNKKTIESKNATKALNFRPNDAKNASQNPKVRQGPQHVTLTIDNNLSASDFEKNIFGEKVPDYGLVGLHTCGDLGPTLVNNYYSGSRLMKLLLMLSFG